MLCVSAGLLADLTPSMLQGDLSLTCSSERKNGDRESQLLSQLYEPGQLVKAGLANAPKLMVYARN